jgi:hypothetical protein
MELRCAKNNVILFFGPTGHISARLSEILVETGYGILEVADARQGLAVLRERPDIALVIVNNDGTDILEDFVAGSIPVKVLNLTSPPGGFTRNLHDVPDQELEEMVRSILEDTGQS